MLGVAAFTCRRTGQIDRSLMRLILGLLATLAAVSAVLSFGDSHGLARSTALLGLVPFAISGLILARDLSGALWRHDVRPAR